MSTGHELSWQELRAARERIAQRYPSPFRLPLVHRPTDVLYAHLEGAARMLDVGAGDATRRGRVHARFPSLEYVSVDPDPQAGADHASLTTVTGPFDVAALLEVVEHVPPATALALVRGVRAVLRPGGVLVVSVPCTHTPGRFERDCTHMTPWAHDELGALLEMAGLRVTRIVRTYPGSFVRRLVRRAVLGPIGHAFGLDYAYSVVAAAERATD